MAGMRFRLGRASIAAAFVLTMSLLNAPTVARADLITFQALLSGSQEVPPNGSPGSGIGSVVLDNVANTITVNLSWINLTTPATAAHIHGPAAPGVNAAVLFPLAGVPSATVGAIPEQVFAITAAQITSLSNGLFYFNVHNATFPGGEIRGQIGATVPEPSPLALSSVVGLMIWGSRFLKRRVQRLRA